MKRATRVLVAFLLIASGMAFLNAAESLGAGPYFNSSEPGCDGSDPNVVWCDDFERGSWFFTMADVSNPANAGWNGTPFGSVDPKGQGWGRCGSLGVAGTNCAATSGVMSGNGGQAPAMADHNLGPSQSSYTELYMRHYRKFSPGFQFGQEKYWTVNKCCAGTGGIYFAQHFTFPGGASGILVGNVPAEDRNLTQNVSQISFTPGNWYAIEIHIKLNTPGTKDGVWELWIDNCGPTGAACTGTSTLRGRYTDVMWRRAGDSSLIGSLWLENWSAEITYGAMYPSSGEEFYDQIKVSRARVGLFGGGTSGASSPPAPPSGVLVR